MRPEAKAWWEQAQIDIEAARSIYDIEYWFAAAFFAQQAAEKAMKALFIVKQRHESPKTHNLVAIGEALGAPERIIHALAEVSPAYTISRYPDAANGLPAQAYNDELSRDVISNSEEILAWVSEKLQQT